MNSVVLIGRLTRDVDLRFLAETGTPVATFTLAISRDFKNKNGEREVDFIPVQLMGKIAENCTKYIAKGSLVAISGSLRIDKYTKDDEKRTYTKVVANNIQFLDTKKNENRDKEFTPNFDTSDFQAMQDDDIPF